MRKLIVAIIILAVLGGGYYWLSTRRLTISALEGKTVKARRGDLVVPIRASGNVEPASVRMIKGEASGEVMETPFDKGQMVKQGDLIVRLNEDDEQRNVLRATAERDRAQVALDRANAQLIQQRDVGVLLAEARRDQSKAQRDLARVDWDKKKELERSAPNAVHPMEVREAEARLEEAEASLRAMEAEVKQAQTMVKLAELDVKTAGQTLDAAQNTLEDAEERLRETKVYSPVDGMIVKRHVEVGEVVQSGKTSLTGGTVLIEIADVGDIYAVVNVDEADIGQVRDLAPPSAVPGLGDPRPSSTLAAGGTVSQAVNHGQDARATQEGNGPAASQPTSVPTDLIEVGQEVKVTVEAFRDEKEEFHGVIEQIAPQSEYVQAIATFKVWIRVTSPNQYKLRGLLNAQADAHFTARSVHDAVLVDYDAIQKDPDGEGFGVYVPVTKPGQEKREPEFRPCEFGVDNGVDVEVVSGLEEGAEVYIKLPQKTRREREEAGEEGGGDED